MVFNGEGCATIVLLYIHLNRISGGKKIMMKKGKKRRRKENEKNNSVAGWI